MKTKNIRWGRILIAGFLAELIPIIALILVVIVYSTMIVTGQSEAYYQQFAEEAGLYVGPIVGFFAAFLCAWWVGRKLHSHFILNGILVGLVVTFLGVSILLAMEADFRIIFVISYSGKILAGALGGFVAQKRASFSAGD